MNSKGQAGPVFELLVQAVIGLFILVIVVSAISYFENQRYAISGQRFNEKILTAANQPNGDVLVVEGIAFNSGSMSSKFVSLKTGISAECIDFEAKDNALIEVSSDGKTVSFEKSMDLDVFIKCCPTAEDCFQSIECTVSFGKKLEQGCS
ncbi:MAG: hypothetical protein ABIA76_00290 [Candidatus Diapherotrites archaeon]